jgi:hypothetical protein
VRVFISLNRFSQIRVSFIEAGGTLSPHARAGQAGIRDGWSLVGVARKRRWGCLLVLQVRGLASSWREKVLETGFLDSRFGMRISLCYSEDPPASKGA